MICSTFTGLGRDPSSGGRLWHTKPCSQRHDAMVSDTYVPNEGITTPKRLAIQWSAPAEASER